MYERRSRARQACAKHCRLRCHRWRGLSHGGRPTRIPCSSSSTRLCQASWRYGCPPARPPPAQRSSLAYLLNRFAPARPAGPELGAGWLALAHGAAGPLEQVPVGQQPGERERHAHQSAGLHCLRERPRRRAAAGLVAGWDCYRRVHRLWLGHTVRHAAPLHRVAASFSSVGHPQQQSPPSLIPAPSRRRKKKPSSLSSELSTLVRVYDFLIVRYQEDAALARDVAALQVRATRRARARAALPDSFIPGARARAGQAAVQHPASGGHCG